MKKFVSFSKLLSRRILIVNIVTISILALLVISFATVGLKNMTRAYYQSGLFASHESIEKRIGHVDSESLYRHIKRIDVGFNDFNPLFTDTNEKDDKEVWAYNIVIDSLGNYLYHPDRQRIGKGNFFDDIRQSPDALRQQLARGLATAEIGEQKITVDGVSSYIFYFGMGDAKWTNAIIVPRDGLVFPTVITGLILLTIIILGLLAAYWISRVTIRRATKPLQLLAKSADEVAKGNFQSPLPEVKRNNEIGQLRDSFSNMQHSLTEYIEQLKTATAQQAAIESELTIAREIQFSLLPQMPPRFLDEPSGKAERGGSDIYATMTPAKAVGGDLYDFFITPADESSSNLHLPPSSPKMFFCIGDVSGKGIPAALFMTQTMSLFRAYSKDEDMPDRIVSKMNHALSMNNENCMFVTFFVGILDLSSGLLRYCNAGHEPPIVVRSKENGSNGEKEAQLLPVEPCFPVGLSTDVSYVTQTVVLEPQTTVFLYTDGLNEAMDADDNQFGDDRILDEVNRAIQAGQLAPKALIERMTQAVHDFVGDTEQSDDLTMLVIQYHKHD